MTVSPVFQSASTGCTCNNQITASLVLSGIRQGSSGSQGCCSQLLAVVASLQGVVYVLPNMCPPPICHQACFVNFVTLHAAAEVQSDLTQSTRCEPCWLQRGAPNPPCYSHALIATAWDIWTMICTSLLMAALACATAHKSFTLTAEWLQRVAWPSQLVRLLL